MTNIVRNNGHIWIPTPEVVVDMHKADGPGLTSRYAGYVRAVVRDKWGSVKQDTGWFKNHLMNNFFIYKVDVDTSWSSIRYCILGDGTGTPTDTDSALWGSQLGDPKGSHSSANYVVAGEYARQRFTYRWESGTFAGNVTEMSIWDGNNTSSYRMHQHTRIVDSGGSPTTLVKGLDDVLEVTWECRHYPQPTTTGTVSISGVSYDYSIEACDLYNHTYTDWHALPTNQYKFAGGYAAHLPYTGQTHPGPTNTTNYTGVSVSPSAFSDSGFSAAPYEHGTTTGNWYVKNLLQGGIDSWTSAAIGSFNNDCGGSHYNNTFAKTSDGTGIVKTDEQRLRIRWQYNVDRY